MSERGEVRIVPSSERGPSGPARKRRAVSEYDYNMSATRKSMTFVCVGPVLISPPACSKK